MEVNRETVPTPKPSFERKTEMPTTKKASTKGRARKNVKKGSTAKKAPAKKATPKPKRPPFERTDPDVSFKIGRVDVFTGPASEFFNAIDGKGDGPNLKQRMILAAIANSKNGLTVLEIAEVTGQLPSTIGLIVKSDKYDGLLSQKLVSVKEIEAQNGESGSTELVSITAAGKKLV